MTEKDIVKVRVHDGIVGLMYLSSVVFADPVSYTHLTLPTTPYV